MSQKTSLWIIFTTILLLASSVLSSTEQYQRKITPAGVWDVKGIDVGNTRWMGTLVLIQSEGDNAVTGHVDWLSDTGHSGRERMVGEYDPATRILKMHGHHLEFDDNIARGSYQAKLSLDGARLEEGKWSDYDPIVPGEWSAQRIYVK